MRKPAAFLDRDGVICDFVDHLHRVEDMSIRKNSAEAIKLLNEAGFWVFVATNQPMIANGLLTTDGLDHIHKKMLSDLESKGASLDKIYFCPHKSTGVIKEYAIECNCRKPHPGMLTLASQEYEIDKNQSFMVGDTWRDVECARNFGIKAFAVLGGAGYPYADDTSKPSPDYLGQDLLDVVKNVLGMK